MMTDEQKSKVAGLRAAITAGSPTAGGGPGGGGGGGSVGWRARRAGWWSRGSTSRRWRRCCGGCRDPRLGPTRPRVRLPGAGGYAQGVRHAGGAGRRADEEEPALGRRLRLHRPDEEEGQGPVLRRHGPVPALQAPRDRALHGAVEAAGGGPAAADDERAGALARGRRARAARAPQPRAVPADGGLRARLTKR